MRPPDREQLVEVNRTRLRIWEWGDESAPPLICVHGAHDHGRMWDELAPRLADELGYRVVAPDLRGHGDSGGLSSGHLWVTSALDLGELARHTGPPVRYVAHSFGAGLAMYAASVWPEDVAWVVNLDGLGFGGDGPDDDWDIAEDAARGFSHVERTLTQPARRYATAADMVQRRAEVNVRLPREWVEHLVAHGSVEDEGGFRWKADPMFRTGFPGDWDVEYADAEHALLERPLLVLTGAEDDTWSDHAPETVATRVEKFADARHETVPDAGHYVHIEQPDLVLDAIRRFADEVGR